MTGRDGDWRQATPVGLRRFAQEYLQVATDALGGYRERLPEVQRHHTHVPFPIYFNFLHSVELALKSFLVHTGSDLRELMRIGHDLEAALDLCLQRGIMEHCEGLTDVFQGTIRHANGQYSQKDFEYIRVGHVELAHIDQVALAARALVDCVSAIDMQPVEPA